MAIKNLKQRSFGDGLLVNHKALLWSNKQGHPIRLKD
jgi:hypothetical protein